MVDIGLHSSLESRPRGKFRPHLLAAEPPRSERLHVYESHLKAMERIPLAQIDPFCVFDSLIFRVARSCSLRNRAETKRAHDNVKNARHRNHSTSEIRQGCSVIPISFGDFHQDKSRDSQISERFQACQVDLIVDSSLAKRDFLGLGK